MWRLLSIGVIAFCLIAPAPAFAQGGEIAGTAHVIDGDSLTIGGQQVRLYGIDAFEWDQECRSATGHPYRCGVDAFEKVKALLRRHGYQAACAVHDTDRYGRQVALCRAPDSQGTDIGEALIRAGLAVAYTRYLEGEPLARYTAAEAAARKGRIGAWAGSFDTPEAWRHGR